MKSDRRAYREFKRRFHVERPSMLTHRCDRVKRRFHVERCVFESGIPSELRFKTAVPRGTGSANGWRSRGIEFKNSRSTWNGSVPGLTGATQRVSFPRGTELFKVNRGTYRVAQQPFHVEQASHASELFAIQAGDIRSTWNGLLRHPKPRRPTRKTGAPQGTAAPQAGSKRCSNPRWFHVERRFPRDDPGN